MNNMISKRAVVEAFQQSVQSAIRYPAPQREHFALCYLEGWLSSALGIEIEEMPQLTQLNLMDVKGA